MAARRFVLLLFVALFNVSVRAQQVCPCVPIARMWIVSACDSWNCAAAALVIANGDPDVLSIPSGSDDFKWVVIRHVAVGSAVVSPDAPFKVESFATLSDAMTRFSAIDPDFRPLLYTAPEGDVLIVSRNTSQPRRRAASK